MPNLTILPLKHYDEVGRIKPHRFYILSLLIAARGYFVLLAALSYREDSSSLLRLFYPDANAFYLMLALGIPALFCLLVCSFRERLWQKQCCRPFGLLLWLPVIGLFFDLILHLSLAYGQHWRFSWSIAANLLLAFAAMLYIVRSQHLRLFMSDWCRHG